MREDVHSGEEDIILIIGLAACHNSTYTDTDTDNTPSLVYVCAAIGIARPPASTHRRETAYM